MRAEITGKPVKGPGLSKLPVELASSIERKTPRTFVFRRVRKASIFFFFLAFKLLFSEIGKIKIHVTKRKINIMFS